MSYKLPKFVLLLVSNGYFLPIGGSYIILCGFSIMYHVFFVIFSTINARLMKIKLEGVLAACWRPYQPGI